VRAWEADAVKTPAVIALVIGLTLNAGANILMKVSALRLEARGQVSAIGQFLEPWFVVGAASFVLALVAYRKALQSFPLSVAYPLMTSCGYLIVLAASFFFLKETLSPKQLAGIACLVLGVWLTASH